MPDIRNYRDLKVWQRSIDLVVDVYHTTKGFPREELYGLTSQSRRAAASVPANIAEGHSRSHRKDIVRFLEIAHGSLAEVETHLIVAFRLAYLTESNLTTLLSRTAEIGRMLNGLRHSLRAEDA